MLQHEPDVALQLHQRVAREDAGRERTGAAETPRPEPQVAVIGAYLSGRGEGVRYEDLRIFEGL